MGNLPTVAVAVCAYNEERNIRQFLFSVLSQKEIGYSLREIILISDGSTDNTVKLAKSLKNSELRIIKYVKRAGKSGRLSELYKAQVASDVLVQFDADVILTDEMCIANLVEPIINNNRIVMTSGRALPLKVDSIIEKAIYMTDKAYEAVREIKKGNNKFTVQGRILAFSSDFIKTVHIPSEVIGNDAFVYLACISRGFNYKYVENARVYYYLPKSIDDHIKQNSRFEYIKNIMNKYFNDSLVDREFYVPKKILYAGMFKQFVRNPILGIFIFLVNTYTRTIGRKKWKEATGDWKIAESTKFIRS